MSKVIGFYTAGLPFEGDSLEKGASLGGSETAFIQLTRALARQGHQILAFTNCQRPGRYHGVEYYTLKDSLAVLAQKQFDVFVVSRYFSFFTLPFAAKLKVLWNHDTLDNPKELRQIHDEIDLFLVLSQFHKDNFLLRLPQLDDRLVLTRNGLDLDLLDKSANPGGRDPHKLIYASRPERGLRLLLESIWPRLYTWNPDLRLYICGYSVKEDSLPSELTQTYRQIDALLSKAPGVTILGSLDKESYYRHLSESALMLYPSTFPEISCIAALEAQSLGVPILTSNAFALSETVVEERLKVSGKPGSPEYVNNYLERAIDLLSAPENLAELGKACRAKVRPKASWETIATEWGRLFDLNLRAKNYHNIVLETEVAPHAKSH